MIANFSLFFCLVLINFPFGEELEISEFAVPSSVEVGENAELQCKYSLDSDDQEGALFVKWWWTPLLPATASPQRVLIYQRIAGQQPQTLHFNMTAKEQDTILVLGLQPEDSGTFECEVSDIDEVRQHQDMIVYSAGSGPLLNVSLTADGPDDDDAEDVVVTCEAHEVAPLPDLAITLNGEVLEADETVSGPERGVYDIAANVTLSAALAVAADIRCELFFADENISHPAYVDSLKYELAGLEHYNSSTTQANYFEDSTNSSSLTDLLTIPKDASVTLNTPWFLIIGCILMKMAVLLL